MFLLYVARSPFLAIWLLCATVVFPAVAVSRFHVAGTLRMHASNPPALQEPNATAALKRAIAIGLSAEQVNTGMVEVSVLLERVAASSDGPVVAEYRIVVPSSSTAFNSSEVVQNIIARITATPVQMAFQIQQALVAADVPTLVTNVQVLPPALDTIYDDACSFRYWRFLPVKARGGYGSGAAVGELALYDGGMNTIPVTQANAPSSASNAFDGDSSTAWESGNLLPIELDFQRPQSIDFYRWTTANLATSYDIVRWRLEASSDRVIWRVVDERALLDHETPGGRRIPAGLFKVGCEGAAPITALDGATDQDGILGLSPAMWIAMVLAGLLLVAFCTGACIFVYSFRHRRKVSRVVPVPRNEYEQRDDGSKGATTDWIPSPLALPESSGLLRDIDSASPPEIQDASGGPSDTRAEALRNGGALSGEFDSHPAQIEADVRDSQALLPIPPANASIAQLDSPEEPPLRMTQMRSALPADAAQPPAIPQEDDFRIFCKGTKVEVMGLVENPAKNGTLAEVVRYEPEAKLYLLRTAEMQLVQLRPENVRVRADSNRPSFRYEEKDRFWEGTQVVICRLEQHPENNGTLAEVVRFDQVTGKYIVRLDGKTTTVRLSPDNVELAEHDDGEVDMLGDEGD